MGPRERYCRNEARRAELRRDRKPQCESASAHYESLRIYYLDEAELARQKGI